MVIRAIREYLEHRHLPSMDRIENDIETVKRIIESKIRKYDSASTTLGQRIVKAELYGVEQLLSELKTNLATKNLIDLPLSLIRDIISDNDINTPSMVKLIIKTYLNLQIEENKRKRREILVGFRLAASKDLFRCPQGRGGMSLQDTDRRATTITDFYFKTEGETSNSRKYKGEKFFYFSFGGYIK